MKKKSENTEVQKERNRSDASMEISDVNNAGITEKMLNAEAEKDREKKIGSAESEDENKIETDTGTENENEGETDTGAEDENEGETDSVNEEDEKEKLLFRDTTSELVDAAVRSLNQQGLESVQYRQEEDTYAVYASPEEFERARELLIEILKDEAENISERARTLEAKRTLRIMETTEMAPGFQPEKTPKEKYEDANSTAIAFLLVGALGIVFVVLEYFDIFFSLGLAGNVRYIFYPTMLAMFGAFLIVGFISMKSAAKWKIKMYEETRIMNNVREYVEHDLIHEIRTIMEERIVRDAEETKTTVPAAEQPAPEDALIQLTHLIEGGFPGEDALEEAEQRAREASENPEENGSIQAGENPEESGPTETSENPEENGSTQAGENPEENGSTQAGENPEENDAADADEMENVFNDYYVMEHEIHLRLLKEFPDLPANLLLEATEYVIKLVEESFADERDAQKDEADEYHLVEGDEGSGEVFGNDSDEYDTDESDTDGN